MKCLLLLLLVPSACGQYIQSGYNKGPAAGAPTISLAASADSGFAATLTLSTAAGVSSGGGVIVACIAPSTYTSTLTFVDSGGNTGYQQDLSFTGTGYADYIQFYSDYVTTAISPGGHVIVTLSNGLSENWHCYLLIATALASTGWFDKSATNSNSFGASQSTGTTSATSNANDYCIPAFVGQSTGWGTVTWNNSYTQLSLGTILSASRYAGVGWKALSSTGTQTMTISLTTSDNTNGAMVCYKQ